MTKIVQLLFGLNRAEIVGTYLLCLTNQLVKKGFLGGPKITITRKGRLVFALLRISGFSPSHSEMDSWVKYVFKR